MKRRPKPNDAEAYYKKGDFYYFQEKYEEAINEYSKAIELKPDFEDAYNNRGIIYNSLGQHRKAINDYSKAIELKPDFAEAYYNRGNSYNSLEKYEEAIADYNKAIELKPDYPEAYNKRGDAYDSLGQHRKAINDYNKAIELKPDFAEAYNNKGLTYDFLGQHQKAINDYNIAIELKPNFLEAYYNRGNIYGKMHLYKEAITDYDKAIELKPDFAEAYYYRGNAYGQMHQYEKAVCDYTKTIELKPDFVEAYYFRGNTFGQLRQYEKAVIDYSRAIELKPDFADAYYFRGNTFGRMRQYEKAISDFSKVIELNPNFAKAYYYRGNTFGRISEYERAVRDYTEAIKLNTSFVDAYYFRGNTFGRMRQYEEAISDFSKVIELKPSFVDAYYYRGNTYDQLGKYEKAISDYNKTIELRPTFMNAYHYRSCITEKMTNAYFPDNIISEYAKKSDTFLKIIPYLSYEMIDHYVDLFLQENKRCDFFKIIENDNDQYDEYKNIYINVLKILNLLYINKKNNKYAHYTTRTVAGQLVIKKSVFRLSSILSVNDPEEGETLFKYLNSTNDYKDKKSTFIGCFCFNIENLNQFRLYGKEKLEECSGVSIVINDDYFYPYEYSDNMDYPSKKDDKSQVVNKEETLYQLARCIYVDPKNKKKISISHSDEEKETDIKKIRDQVEEHLETIETKINGKDSNIINKLLLPIRFLVKNAAFKEEQECRIIYARDIMNGTGRKVYFTDDYSQMYVEYKTITNNCLNKIIFAPKAKGYEVFKEALKYEGINCECEKSELPFA